MPLPDNQLLNAEIVVYGQISSGGSSVVNTVNVFHYKRQDVVNVMSKTALDTAFQAAIVVKLALALNNRWTQLFNTIRMVDDALDPPTNFSHAEVGGVAGDGQPALSSVFINLRTNLRGQNFRGSKHFGPLSEADATAPDADVLNAAAVTRFTTLITALGTTITDGTPNSWKLEVLSRNLSKLKKNPTTITATQVNAILLNKRIGRLRRREPRSVY